MKRVKKIKRVVRPMRMSVDGGNDLILLVASVSNGCEKWYKNGEDEKERITMGGANRAIRVKLDEHPRF